VSGCADPGHRARHRRWRRFRTVAFLCLSYTYAPQVLHAFGKLGSGSMLARTSKRVSERIHGVPGWATACLRAVIMRYSIDDLTSHTSPAMQRGDVRYATGLSLGSGHVATERYVPLRAGHTVLVSERYASLSRCLSQCQTVEDAAVGNRFDFRTVKETMTDSRNTGKSIAVPALRSWSAVTVGVCAAVVVVSLAGCGDSSQDDGSLDEQSATQLASLPIVDLSRSPVADDPDPSVRAGAVADFVDCEYGIWQGGWTSDFGPLGSGTGPDEALEDMIDGETLGMPDEGFAAVGRDEDRVLYTYDVGGVAKAALVIADSTRVELETKDRWAIETFASCDPSEFDPSTDGAFPQEVWMDADGDRVPTSVITSSRGPEHCGWESATFLRVDGRGYISDPEGVLDGKGFVAPFDADAELPSDAIDTGYQQQGLRLWLSNDRLIAFVVTADRVEAWPSSTEEFGCA